MSLRDVFHMRGHDTFRHLPVNWQRLKFSNIFYGVDGTMGIVARPAFLCHSGLSMNKVTYGGSCGT